MTRCGWIVVALAVATVTVPRVLEAQQGLPAAAPKPGPVTVDPKIAEFARLYAEVNATKEEFIVKFGRIHDAAGRKTWREEYDAKILQILTAHGTDRAQFEAMVFKVSTDPVLIPQFEQALKAVAAG